MPKKFVTLAATSKQAIGDGLSFRILKEKGRKAELALVISDSLTAEGLRKAWPTIDRLRTQLRQAQGSPMNRFDMALIYGYASMKVGLGYSYALISHDINFDVLVNLIAGLDEAGEESVDVERTEGYAAACALLRCMRMKENNIREWLVDGLEQLQNGHAPWSVDRGPIDAGRVREALRQLERDLQSGKIVIKEAPKTETISIDELAPKNDKFLSQATSLLMRDFPKPFERYRQRLRKKLEEEVAAE
jgi:hypothetical protein